MTISSVGKIKDPWEFSYINGENVKLLQFLFWNSGLAISYKVKQLSKFPEIITPRFLPPKLKTYIHTKTQKWMLLTAAFLRAQKWKYH